jgi:hypothetical protein
MPAIINKTDARKTVRDAGDGKAKAGTNGAAVDSRTAHDASEAGDGTVRKDRVAGSRAVTRENAGEAAEQSLQKAAEDLRGPMESRELAGRTQQNLGAMIQTGVKLADGFQTIMREWADYTRAAMQCNIDGMNSIMRARTPQDLMTAQRELINAEVQVMLNSGVRISEATLRIASDAVQSIPGRTK